MNRHPRLRMKSAQHRVLDSAAGAGGIDELPNCLKPKLMIRAVGAIQFENRKVGIRANELPQLLNRSGAKFQHNPGTIDRAKEFGKLSGVCDENPAWRGGSVHGVHD